MAPKNFLYEAHLQEQKKLQVWAKGRVIPGYNPDHWRWDAFRTPIKYTDYGNQSSPNGWQFDHYPLAESLGGTDDVSNLRPLHHATNASLGGLLGGILGKQ
jgi:hypothetical protein